MPKDTRIDIRIHPELKAAAKRKAAQQGTTLTHIIIKALRDYLLSPEAP